MGELASEIENAVSLDYADIKLGRSTVVGHAGKLVYGDLAGRKSWHCKVVSISTKILSKSLLSPVRVMKSSRCDSVIVTNAPVVSAMVLSTLMAVLTINMTGQNHFDRWLG